MALTINGMTFNKLQQWQVDFLKENYQKLKLSDLIKELRMCDETIYRLLKALNLKRERMWYRKLPNTNEVKKDLENPYLSHVKIADKYSVTPDVVAQRRKRSGLSVRRNVGRTRLEEKIASVLDELDIVFHEQKRISKWSIDFYLGNKVCVDVHGEYIHSKPIAKDRDRRKTTWLQENGYKYIVIHEDVIKSSKEILINELGEMFPWIKQEV
jgi:very-short-patch-repair endonuclease